MKRWIRKTEYWVVGLILALVIVRAVLPYAVKEYVNNVLDGIPGYYGYIEDVDLAIWRGAYSIDDMKFVKLNGDDQEPLFSADEIEISIDWAALFKGRLVTKIHLDEPALQFIVRKSEESSQTKVDKSWQDQIGKLYPFEINRLSFDNAVVRYKDETRTPKLNVYFRDLDLDARNISNVEETGSKLPSTVKMNGRFLETGRVDLNAKMNAIAIPAQFDVNTSIRNLSLKEVNDFTKAYGGFDFETGKLDVTLELAASKDKYSGYTKTIMKDVDVLNLDKERKEGDSVGTIIWEGLVGGALEIFENQKRDQFAARLPISGSRDDLSIDSWAAVGSILKNAFISAMDPKLEDSVDFADAKKDKKE
ncbi:MAG: DUF748 domain-containing protein [Bdellovibrionota bacterium]